jgi:two-component system response regulator PilR (NtrC family)
VDVRLVAATNRRLEEEVAAGRFREDLYYRLNVIPISIPPLRERLEDVPLLVQHFIDKYARELGKEVRGMSEEASRLLLAYDFPGNVRELENVIERAVALCSGSILDEDALPPTILDPPARSQPSRLPLQGTNLDGLVASFERDLLREALSRTGGIKKKAAQLLGISFRSFRYRFEKLGLESSADDPD